MPRLNWSAIGQRFYEMGVDRGVLYVDSQPGVPWTGLISVSESPSGGEPKPYYVDGFKYLNVASSEEFAATIEAFSSPPEFDQCDGTRSIANGLFATQQPRKPFGFSYRTRIGNDVDGPRHAYKIHIVYNALAAPSSRNNQSMGSSIEPVGLSWSITTLPPSVLGLKPTAHFVVDSRKTPKNLLTTLEDILYGSASSAPRLPDAQELWDLFTSKGPILRTNLATDPAAIFSAVVDGQLWWNPTWYGPAPAAGVTTLETGPTPIPHVTSFMRKTWSTTATGGDTGFTHGKDGSGYIVTPGQTFTISSHMRCSVTGKRGNIRFRYFDSSGVQLSALRNDGPYTNLVPGEWHRIAHTATVPEGVAWMVPWSNSEALGSSPWAVGDQLDGTGLLVEEGSVLNPYFDGSTPDYDDVYMDWLGTPNASQSVVRSWTY